MSAQCPFCEKHQSDCTCEIVSVKPVTGGLPPTTPFPTSKATARFVYVCERCKKIVHETLQSKPTPEQAKKLINQCHDIIHIHECGRTDGGVIYGVAKLLGMDIVGND